MSKLDDIRARVQARRDIEDLPLSDELFDPLFNTEAMMQWHREEQAREWRGRREQRRAEWWQDRRARRTGTPMGTTTSPQEGTP